jgi:threonine synthase
LQVVENIGDEVDFVVPSGNFGNVLSGFLAKKIGLPIRRLIVATNENNVLDKLIKTGTYELTPAEITSSPSMDISKASNYERLVFDIFNGDANLVKKYMQIFTETGKVSLEDFGLDKNVFVERGFYSGSSTHQDRMNTIKKIYEENNLIIDTHSADAVKVGLDYYEKNIPMVCMSTALPVKFENSIREAIGFIPAREE